MSNYSELLKDPRWQKKRLEIMTRDNWTCQHCQSTEKTLNVHHMKYGPTPWDANPLWMITLCEECHEIETTLSNENPILKTVASQAGVPVLMQLELIRRTLHMQGIGPVKEAILQYANFYSFNDRVFGRNVSSEIEHA